MLDLDDSSSVNYYKINFHLKDGISSGSKVRFCLLEEKQKSAGLSICKKSGNITNYLINLPVAS